MSTPQDPPYPNPVSFRSRIHQKNQSRNFPSPIQTQRKIRPLWPVPAREPVRTSLIQGWSHCRPESYDYLRSPF